ncbi:MAG: DUF2853 family protein [Bernardetiaceae bacterium]|jgi:hypothetical protein|nr:DUF2853 family protein [Bernardetiaceae bacterium]
MSKFDEAIASYKAELDKVGVKIDDTLLTAVAKGLGPSIYNNDSSRVSCSDNTELERVKKNYLIGKLGLADGPELDKAIKEVCEKLGSANKNKFRAIFYAMLVQKFKKEGFYAK